MSEPQKNVGQCRLCGEHRKLTFEHIPPRGAYNDQAIRIQGYDQLMDEQSIHYGKYSKAPRGSGKYALCPPCQTQTGDWYARHYIKFAKEVYRNLDTRGLRHHSYVIQPFRVLKHALTMFACVESTSGIVSRKDYQRYLLDPKCRQRPSGIRVYFYCNVSGISRLNGWSMQRMENGVIIQCSEVSSFPIGLLLSYDGAKPFPWLEDITDFSTYGEDEVAEVRIRPYILHFPKGPFQAMSANYQRVVDINGNVRVPFINN